MSKPQGNKTMPNRQENAMMLYLMALLNTLNRNSEAVKDRLSVFRYGWRDLRLLLRLVDKVQIMLLHTMPDKRLDYYAKIAEHGKVIVDIPGLIPKGRHILITDKNLAAITEAAMRAECVLCMKDGKGVKGCPIRAALLEVAPPETVNDCRNWWVGCEYRNAASALIQGEEISI